VVEASSSLFVGAKQEKAAQPPMHGSAKCVETLKRAEKEAKGQAHFIKT
jgi:hypothetical protein